MKNIKTIILIMIALAGAPLTSYGQPQAAGTAAAGGMSVGTAVAIGVVGAALLVALGDSSSSAPAAVAAGAAGNDVAITSTKVTDVTTSTTDTGNVTSTTTN